MTTEELNKRSEQRQTAASLAIAKVTALNEVIKDCPDWRENPISATYLLDVLTESLTDDWAQTVVDYCNSI